MVTATRSAAEERKRASTREIALRKLAAAGITRDDVLAVYDDHAIPVAIVAEVLGLRLDELYEVIDHYQIARRSTGVPGVRGPTKRRHRRRVQKLNAEPTEPRPKTKAAADLSGTPWSMSDLRQVIRMQNQRHRTNTPTAEWLSQIVKNITPEELAQLPAMTIRDICARYRTAEGTGAALRLFAVQQQEKLRAEVAEVEARPVVRVVPTPATEPVATKPRRAKPASAPAPVPSEPVRLANEAMWLSALDRIATEVRTARIDAQNTDRSPTTQLVGLARSAALVALGYILALGVGGAL